MRCCLCFLGRRANLWVHPVAGKTVGFEGIRVCFCAIGVKPYSSGLVYVMGVNAAIIWNNLSYEVGKGTFYDVRFAIHLQFAMLVVGASAPLAQNDSHRTGQRELGYGQLH
jgi:hypothetical protein